MSHISKEKLKNVATKSSPDASETEKFVIGHKRLLDFKLPCTSYWC